MNFLPFVFTFLMVLTLMSSFLFSSLMGTARENKVILVQHKTYLQLLSDQNEKKFKDLGKHERKKKPPGEKKEPGPPDMEKAPRALNQGFEKSKFNLIPLIHGDESLIRPLLEHTAIRLIELLYGSCSFYSSKNMARDIVKLMMEQKVESLEELKFNNNKQLEQAYYKMLKGTNTGYPALGEYLSFSKESSKVPIFFKYASKPVLQAALGDELSKKVFDQEMKNWLKNRHCKVLKKEDLTTLLTSTPTSLIPQNQIGSIINFESEKKGLQQIHKEQGQKIRALHTFQ